MGPMKRSILHILAGLAIVENAFDETGKIEAVLPAQFESREKELLVLAKQWMPRLPFDRVDLLVVDQIGKNISGTGMDTNVIGRKFADHQAIEGELPKVRLIAVRDLTEQTHGNATGIGKAEFCKSSLLKKADMRATRLNCLTAGYPASAMPALDYDTDRQMIDAALSTIGLTGPEDARVLWIRNTLDLEEIECSTAYLDAAQKAGVPAQAIQLIETTDREAVFHLLKAEEYVVYLPHQELILEEK